MKIKKLFFTTAMALILLLSLPNGAKAKSFSDTKGHWAENYIDWAAQNGYIKGYPDGSFKPDAPLKRAELFTIINALYENSAYTSSTSWADSAAEKIIQSDLALARFKIYEGKGSKKLLPASRIEALQLLATVYNFYTIESDPPFEVKNEEPSSGEGSMDYSKYDKNVLIKMGIETGVMGGFGDGTYGPYRNLTRSQFCKMLYTATKWRFPNGGIERQNDSTWQNRVRDILHTKLPQDGRSLYIAAKNRDNYASQLLFYRVVDEYNGPDYENKNRLLLLNESNAIYSFSITTSRNGLYIEKMERRSRDNGDFLENWYTKVVNEYSGSGTDYDKAKYIHDVITHSTHYIDFDIVKYGYMQAIVKYGNNDFAKPISVAKGTGTICMGYAATFDALAKKMGLESIVVTGKTRRSNHAWNKVKIDGQWYNVDTTWDDPSIPGNENNVSGSENSENFLRSDAFIAQTRRQLEEFDKYIAPADYN